MKTIANLYLAKLPFAASVILGASLFAQGGLPPVPVPAGNPITPAKTILGKLLFWEEQMSSDNRVACGTCHRAAQGGGDQRVGVNPVWMASRRRRMTSRDRPAWSTATSTTTTARRRPLASTPKSPVALRRAT